MAGKGDGVVGAFYACDGATVGGALLHTSQLVGWVLMNELGNDHTTSVLDID